MISTMIKYITVELEDINGVCLKSTWCHPNNREMVAKGFKKMPDDPIEWFRKLVNERMEPGPWDSDAVEIG